MKENISNAFREDSLLEGYMKSYMFLKGYAIAKGLEQTLIALSLSKRYHTGHVRDDGSPVISHPLKVCTTLVSYGIDDDKILAAALLHDVLEDCQDQLPLHGRELVTEYHLSQEVLDIIILLTKEKGLSEHELKVYFEKIRANPEASLIKLSDRLHNSSTLYSFSLPRMKKYIAETNTFIIPLAQWCKSYYVQYANAFAILKSNIYSLNHSMSVIIDKYETASEHVSDTETLSTSG